jgi:HEAT repeat protein
MRKITILTFALALLCLLAPAQTANLDDLLAQTARWQYETSRQPLQGLSEVVAKAQSSPAGIRAIEQKFIAFLKSDATPGGKDFICKQLSVMGSEASVPVLIALLADPKTADLGRYALERIPGPGVDRALRDALPANRDRTRIGIVNTLGVRRDAASVAALRPLALGSQPAEASAALFALAKIADPASLAVLSEAQGKTTGAAHADAAEAWLQAANRLTERGNAVSAVPIFRTLYATKDPGTVQAAALHGLANAGGAQAVPVLMEALRGNDARLQAIAIDRLIPGSAGQLMTEMPKLSEAAQIRILGLLAERGAGAGSDSALPAFTAALQGSSKPVRMAALKGIGMVGNASTVPVLAAIAAGNDTAEQAAARAALGQIRGREADQAVADGIATAAPKVKLELIRAAGDRAASAAAPILMKMARDADPDVRRESLRAMRDTGSANDIGGLVALVVEPVQAGDRTEAVKSLGAILRRSDPSAILVVVSAYTPAHDPEARAALMQVMGQSGNAEALVILRAALNDPDAGARRAAILALTEWPDVTPVPDLFASARSASNPAHQVLALRGALQLIGLPAPSRPPRESVKMLAEAMGLATHAEEKRAVMALLPKFPVREALDLANASVNDSEVTAEAKAAVNRLERTVRNR